MAWPHTIMIEMKALNWLCVLAGAAVLAGCISTANTKFLVKRDSFNRNYNEIKAIAVQEAANNGFGTLTSEVKPSEYNDWTGRLFFQLKTANGTDQLFVEFRSQDDAVNVWVHGAGTRSNPDSASKAIQARVGKLVGAVAPSAEKSQTAARSMAESPPPQPRQAGLQVKPVADAEVRMPAAQPAPMPVQQAARTNEGRTSGPLTATEAQQKLIALGYLKGVADGKLGRNSTDAIKRFQRDRGLAETGALDASTSSQLRDAK